MANLHSGQIGVSRREYDINALTALGYNADGAIIFQFPNVKVRKYYILTEYPDRLEYEETFYENEATHYAELRYSVADGKEIECFHEIIREHSELTTGSSLL